MSEKPEHLLTEYLTQARDEMNTTVFEFKSSKLM